MPSIVEKPVWRGALVADLQAPASPADHEKAAMKQLIASELVDFDEPKLIFGTMSGIALLEEIRMMKHDIAAQASEIQRHKQRLDLLDPVQAQVSLIRKPVLQKLAHWPSNPTWFTEPILRQARNGLADGGQVISDLSTIDLEQDPAESVTLKAGFENLYVVSLDLRSEFTKYKAVINLMNIHANLLTLDVFYGKTRDTNICSSLLKKWSEWVVSGSILDTYPFTMDRTAVMDYNRLMGNYGHANPA